MTKKTEWSHLPNAVHIDRVLASLKANPGAWSRSRIASWTAAREAANKAARGVARTAALDAARTAAWYAARDEARLAAWYAISALIAWDNSAQYLDMTSDELKMWAALSEDPAAILLLPAVRAFEQIDELELI